MNRALFTGLSGTMTFQQSLNVIANNIVNANTTAYKEQRANFKDIFYQTMRAGGASNAVQGAVNPSQMGSGVGLSQVQSLVTQGSLQQTNQPLDAAVSGEGFFVLAGPYGNVYTRDGSFSLDDTNTLVSGSTGMRVMGWVARDGVISTSAPVEALAFPIGQLRAAKATETMTVGGNLDSAADVGTEVVTGLGVYDSLGNLDQVTITFTKTANNAWDVEATDGTSTATGALTFDEDGALTAGSPLALSLAFTNGATTPQSVDLDFTTMSQMSEESTAVVKRQDGYAPSSLIAVELSEGGLVSGRYSDGQSATLGQVALAAFTNTSALKRKGDNLFEQSIASGLPQVGAANTGGRGNIVASALEQSNVDLTKAFVDMVTSQRGFQASANVIAAANEMLQEALRITQR